MTGDRGFQLAISVFLGASLAACTGPRGRPGLQATLALPDRQDPPGPPGTVEDAGSETPWPMHRQVAMLQLASLRLSRLPVPRKTAGFGALVTLIGAASDPDSDASRLTYKWTQTAGPMAVITGASTPTLTFTTQTLAAAKTPVMAQLHFGVLPISPDEAGNYSFELDVTDPQGNVARPRLPSGRTPHHRMQNVPSASANPDGRRRHAATWNWSLDVTGGTGSGATLTGGTTQFPASSPMLWVATN